MKNFRNQDRTKNKYGIPYDPPAGAAHGQEIRTRDPDTWRPSFSRCLKLFPRRLRKDTQQFSLPDSAPAPDLWDGEGLFIYGETGAGKTVYAANMLLDVEKHLWLNFQSKKCLFTSVPKLFQRLKKSFDTDEDETEWKIMEQNEQIWLLVLDDLGVSGKPSEWLIEKLYLLVNARWQHMLPTIITSNLNLNELSELLEGDRITSRIDRMCKIAPKKPWDK